MVLNLSDQRPHGVIQLASPKPFLGSHKAQLLRIGNDERRKRMSTTLADAFTVPPDSGRESKISLIILSLSSFGGYPDLSGRVRGAKCMSELIKCSTETAS